MAQAIRESKLLRPDVILTELRLPGYPGVDGIKALRTAAADAQVIVLTETGDDLAARRALDAGASKFLLKSRSASEIADAIASVVAPLVPPDTQTHESAQLTEREIKVLTHVGKGATIKAIAVLLAVTEAAVRRDLSQAQQKLGAEDRTHAVILAKERGLVDLD